MYFWLGVIGPYRYIHQFWLALAVLPIVMGKEIIDNHNEQTVEISGHELMSRNLHTYYEKWDRTQLSTMSPIMKTD